MRAAQGRPPQHALDPQAAGVGELTAYLQNAVGAQRAGAHSAAGGHAGQMGRRTDRCGHDVTPARVNKVLLAAATSAARSVSSTVTTRSFSTTGRPLTSRSPAAAGQRGPAPPPGRP